MREQRIGFGTAIVLALGVIVVIFIGLGSLGYLEVKPLGWIYTENVICVSNENTFGNRFIVAENGGYKVVTYVSFDDNVSRIILENGYMWGYGWIRVYPIEMKEFTGWDDRPMPIENEYIGQYWFSAVLENEPVFFDNIEIELMRSVKDLMFVMEETEFGAILQCEVGGWV